MDKYSTAHPYCNKCQNLGVFDDYSDGMIVELICTCPIGDKLLKECNDKFHSPPEITR